ncbi:hypothetical protein D9M72_549290 [compost metagenome]
MKASVARMASSQRWIAGASVHIDERPMSSIRTITGMTAMSASVISSPMIHGPPLSESQLAMR